MLLLSLLLAAAQQPAPKPSEVRFFDDWAVACDNGRTCRATALNAAFNNDVDGPLFLAVERKPDATAQPEVIVDGRYSAVPQIEIDQTPVSAIDVAMLLKSQDFSFKVSGV